MTDPVAEMLACEQALLHGDHRCCPEKLQNLLAEDFVEVSAAGSVTSREAVLRWLLEKDPLARWHFEDLEVRELAPLLRLVRYRARRCQPEPPSAGQGALHCSLWRFDPGKDCWQLCFHQATRIS